MFCFAWASILTLRKTTRPTRIRTLMDREVRCTLGFLVVLEAAFFAAVSYRTQAQTAVIQTRRSVVRSIRFFSLAELSSD